MSPSFLVCLRWPPTDWCVWFSPPRLSIWNWTNNSNRNRTEEQSLTLSVLPMASRLQSAGQQMKKKPLTHTNGWKIEFARQKSDDGWLNKYRCWRIRNERTNENGIPLVQRDEGLWRVITTNLACPGLIWSQIDPSVCNCIISPRVIRVCLTLK